ncbi:MAG: hypothetical protein QM767_27515 [Anaeromyxobacter sp.]
MSHLRALAALALLTAAAVAGAQEPTEEGSSSGGNGVIGFAIALGTEQGADGSKKTMLEAEGLLGWEFQNRIRPEVGLVLGLEPDAHGAIRPGVRLPIPSTPIQLRVALDASNARNESFSWRYLLLGAAYELKLTGNFALALELDSGVPLRDSAGVPIMIRLGSVVRP